MNAIAKTSARPAVHATSIRNLIAWLSVCVLAAAWGPALSPQGRETWNAFGLFGLVAALGLDVIARLRRARQDVVAQEVAADVQQRRWVEVDRHHRSVHALRRAMQRVAGIAEQHRLQYDAALAENASGPDDRRGEERTACWMPVELFLEPSSLEGETEPVEQESTLAFVRNLSGTGVGLYHQQPIDAVEAVMRIRTGDGAPLALLATRCWCRPTDDGWHHSGWKLVEILSEMEQDSEVDPGSMLQSASETEASEFRPDHQPLLCASQGAEY